MWFALFDQEHDRETLLFDASLYKIGIYSNQLF